MGLIPPHQRYAEVFAGAGWVFFRKAPSRAESINDINGELVTFYRCLQNHLEEFCKQFKWLLSSRELFEDFQRQKQAGGLTDIQRAARFYYLQRHAYAGKVAGQSFGVSPDAPPPVNLLRLETELSEAHLRLARVTIENLPWAEYVEKYDGEETFFYLDPPYFGSEDYYGKGLFPRSEFEVLAGRLASIRGRFLLSLNDTPEVRATFQGFRIKATKTTYTAAREANAMVREVLITNYEPPTNQLNLCDI